MHVICAMMEVLKKKNTEEYIEGLLNCFAAPVVCGLRCACLLNLKKPDNCGGRSVSEVWCCQKNKILMKHALEAHELTGRRDAGKDVLLLLVYRKKALQQALFSKKASRILEGFGYQTRPLSLESHLLNLEKRFSQSFPHEIGLFLGFPPEDVRGYIQNGGNNARASGYWKVYGNVRRAKSAFAKFKEAESNAARRILRQSGYQSDKLNLF